MPLVPGMDEGGRTGTDTSKLRIPLGSGADNAASSRATSRGPSTATSPASTPRASPSAPPSPSHAATTVLPDGAAAHKAQQATIWDWLHTSVPYEMPNEIRLVEIESITEGEMAGIRKIINDGLQQGGGVPGLSPPDDGALTSYCGNEGRFERLKAVAHDKTYTVKESFNADASSQAVVYRIERNSDGENLVLKLPYARLSVSSFLESHLYFAVPVYKTICSRNQRTVYSNFKSAAAPAQINFKFNL